MLPSLKNNSLVLVNKFAFIQRILFTSLEVGFFNPIKLQLYDIVFLESKEEEMLVKRIIAMPGENYTFKNNTIYVDSENRGEEFSLTPFQTYPPNDAASMLPAHPYRVIFRDGEVPEGYYLVLGDNRSNSTDSRTIGLIPYSKLRGKLLFILKK